MQLRIESLSKTYPNGVKALKNISLTINQGMFGLLGPNGAGKSSLMRTIATLQEADHGRVFLDDLDVLKHKEEVRQILGYLPQDFGVYPRISAEQMLDHIAQLKGIGKKSERKELVSALLDKVNLSKDKKKNLGTYSGGMKQRFGIAQALMGSPKLIIVDEPTAGLDPAERNRFYNLLSQIGENTIVILSTHIVEDVTDLCPRMAMIAQGRVLIQGEPQASIDTLKNKVWRRRVTETALPEYQSHFNILSTRLVGGKPQITVFADAQPDDGFTMVEPNLGDVYFLQLRSAQSAKQSVTPSVA